jgi:hypothetical protein
VGLVRLAMANMFEIKRLSGFLLLPFRVKPFQVAFDEPDKTLFLPFVHFQNKPFS